MAWASPMLRGREAAGESRRVLEVRSQARRRALAVATREGSGGGGLREVVSEVRRDGEGTGRDWESMAARSWLERSIEFLRRGSCEFE